MPKVLKAINQANISDFSRFDIMNLSPGSIIVTSVLYFTQTPKLISNQVQQALASYFKNNQKFNVLSETVEISNGVHG